MYDRCYERAQFVAAPTAIMSLERLASSAELFRSTGRWLDMGYGEGALLDLAEKCGWSCYGVEVSQRVLEHGRARGWVVTSDAASDARFETDGFDVVTMIEFLEHVASPGRFLSEAASWLRPGGLLYITTPNVRGLNGRILGLNWSVVSPPEHLVLWTIAALYSALAKAGFRVFRVRVEGFNPSEVLAVARWWRRDILVDRYKSAVALSEALSRTRSRRALKTAINGGLNILRLGDTLKVWARRVG